MIYEVRINPISGCQELVSLAGVESSTIGCVWKSTDAYACITDCADCSLGMINGAATQLGYNASAVNSSTAIGANANSCCTAIALGCGATATDNGIAIGTNLTACCDEVLIGDKVIINDNTVINGSDGGCSNVVAINATATASCQVAVNGLIDVTSDYVTLGSATGAASAVAIGASTTGTACSVVIGCGASVSCAGDVAIGRGATITCGIDILSTSSEICLNAPTGDTHIGSNNYIHCLTSNTVIGSFLDIGCGVTDSVIIGQSTYIPDGCTLAGVTLIGDLAEIGVDYQETVSSGDVVIGVYNCNPFHYCASNGYTYSGSKLMTGRILNCAAELPLTNCDLVLYYVP